MTASSPLDPLGDHPAGQPGRVDALREVVSVGDALAGTVTVSTQVGPIAIRVAVDDFATSAVTGPLRARLVRLVASPTTTALIAAVWESLGIDEVLPPADRAGPIGHPIDVDPNSPLVRLAVLETAQRVPLAGIAPPVWSDSIAATRAAVHRHIGLAPAGLRPESHAVREQAAAPARAAPGPGEPVPILWAWLPSAIRPSGDGYRMVVRRVADDGSPPELRFALRNEVADAPAYLYARTVVDGRSVACRLLRPVEGPGTTYGGPVPPGAQQADAEIQVCAHPTVPPPERGEVALGLADQARLLDLADRTLSFVLDPNISGLSSLLGPAPGRDDPRRGEFGR